MKVKYFNQGIVEIDIESFITKLVNDIRIPDSAWEKTYQHVIDDLFLIEKGELDFNDCAVFHWNVHHVNIWQLASKYGVMYLIE